MSAHAHPEHGPVPPSSPNKNLALPETDPAQIDPKFAGNRSISGPLYSTQKPATQKAGKKDRPETYGRVGSPINQHSFTQVINVGTERSLRPEVSENQDPNQIAAEYIIWLAKSYEPTRFRSRLLGGKRTPRLIEGVDAAKLTEVISGSDDRALAPVLTRLEKVATSHNTVATINGGAIVGPLLSESDSVVPAIIQEKVSILSGGGLYSKTRRKARKIERDALKTVSHKLGAGSLTAPEIDPRSRVSKSVKKDTLAMHNARHHAQDALNDKFPRKNRRLAFKETPALMREVNKLVQKYNASSTNEQISEPTQEMVADNNFGNRDVPRPDQQLRDVADAGELKFEVGGVVFKATGLGKRGRFTPADGSEPFIAYRVHYTDRAGNDRTRLVREEELKRLNLEDDE